MEPAQTAVGASDAKTHFSKLLARVAAGESFVITRHGTPIARLVPVTTAPAEHAPAELIRQAAALRREVAASPEEIGSWIAEGRT